MKSVRLFTLVLSFMLAAELFTRAQVLFNETFNDPVASTQRFTTFGAVQFTGHDLQLPPNSSVFLNAENAFADSGSLPVRYSIVQAFVPGNIVFPNSLEAAFYVRVPQSLTDGYLIRTYRNSLGAAIFVQRGITTFVGGSIFAPPALYTFGPYEMTVTVWNTDDAVYIDVMAGGVHALTAVDTFPDRLTSGESVGFANYGTRGAFVDNLSVTVIPEPTSNMLLFCGFLVMAAYRGLRTHDSANTRP